MGKYQKYRTARARAAWMLINRLTKLRPREKYKLATSQVIPILLYEAELHDTGWEEGRRLLSESWRWII